MERKIKIWLAAIGGTAVLTTAIVTPVVVLNSKKTTTSYKWGQALPGSVFYVKADGTYTADKTQGVGYVAPQPEVIPNAVGIAPPSSVGDKIVINGTEYIAQSGQLGWSPSLPSTSVWLKVGQDHGANAEYTTNKNLAKGYSAEVKPSIYGETLNSIAGGSAYDDTKFNWKETIQGNAETKPSIDGNEISSLNGGDAYDQNKFVWKITTNGQEEIKPSVKGVFITNKDGGDAYNDALWTYEEVSAYMPEDRPTIQGKALPNSIVSGAPYDASNWTWNEDLAPVVADFPTIKGVSMTGVAKGAAYDASEWTWVDDTAGTGKWQPSYGGVHVTSLDQDDAGTPGVAPTAFVEGTDYVQNEAADGEYSALYATIQTSYALTSASKPADGTEPTGWVPGEYSAGSAAQDATWDVKYSTIKIPGLQFTKSDAKTPVDGTVPAGFTEASDYNSGQATIERVYTAEYDGVEGTTTISQSSIDPAPAKPADAGAANYDPGLAAVQTEYQATYETQDITSKKVSVDFGDAIPNKPTATEASYVSGSAEVIPATSGPDSAPGGTYSDQDKIKIDATEYTAVIGINYVNLPSGPYYKKGSGFVTDNHIDEADGYSPKVPEKVGDSKTEKELFDIAMKSADKKVVIDGNEYTLIKK